MKVLKDGKTWEKVLSCGVCDALLLVESDDIKQDDINSLDGSRTFYFFRCGFCGGANDLEEFLVQEYLNLKGDK